LTINGWQRNLFEVEGTAALDHQASGAADSGFGAAFEGSDNEETRRFSGSPSPALFGHLVQEGECGAGAFHPQS
jgi:hypothetical protein